MNALLRIFNFFVSYLQNNKLEGRLPKYILSDTAEIDVSGNFLNGTLDEQVADITMATVTIVYEFVLIFVLLY